MGREGNCCSKTDDVTGNKDGRTQTDLVGERSALRRHGCDWASLGVRLFWILNSIQNITYTIQSVPHRKHNDSVAKDQPSKGLWGSTFCLVKETRDMHMRILWRKMQRCDFNGVMCTDSSYVQFKVSLLETAKWARSMHSAFQSRIL